tara:strand:+ start:160 stop:687 length:528 start_codon:yes stop_codon:yes gene_type:complete
MPTARKIIFSSYVVPTRIDTMEEESISKTSFLGATGTDTLSKTLGGKGSVTIHATQWGDGWVSFAHQGAYWEDQSDVWELVGETWSGELSITSAVKLTDDTSTTCAFVYIKNTGTSVNAEVSLNDTGGNYFIIIPPGGSVHLRGDGTTLECNKVYVRGASGSSTTTIEYIIAKAT